MKKEIKKLLLVSTGALMSTTSSLQGETIPGIAHAVAIEMRWMKKGNVWEKKYFNRKEDVLKWII